MNHRISYLLIFVLTIGHNCLAEIEEGKHEQHVEVSMRLIGHQVLLSQGDSSSRVLPIKKIDGRYKIAFENDFGFNPDDIATIVDSVIASTGVAKSYIVSIADCETDQTVHMYEVGEVPTENVMACRGRDQPIGCYALFITILDEPSNFASSVDSPTEAISQSSSKASQFLIGGFALLFALGFLIYLKKRSSSQSKHIVSIGEYKFNKRKMELGYKGEKIELTSKECALLELLIESANDIVERDTILKMVWNDEGDYVGRTLDVFISKLRKKLEADSNIKIANIRGIGYKLVIDS